MTWAILFNHFRDNEETGLGLGGIGENGLAITAIRDLIGALRGGGLNNAGQWLDIRRVDFLKHVDPAQDAVQAGGESGNVFVGNGNARQTGDFAGGVVINHPKYIAAAITLVIPLLFPHCAAMDRILAIDIGKKSLGLALYTPAGDIVTPLHTIKRTNWINDVAGLRAVVEEFEVGLIVLGYPLEADGKEGPRCQAVRAFGRMLEKEELAREIVYQDERYSSQAAEDALLALDASRKTRRAVNDAVAAQYILETYRDRTA